MKYTLSVILFFVFVFTLNAQVQKNSLQGKILDSDKNVLPGATVVIVGTKYGVNANESGEFLFDKIPPLSFRVCDNLPRA